MGSTRVSLRLADDDRNVARFNTADVPSSLYVPNQGSATLSPLKVGKSTMTAWTIPNATFPMPGQARWWEHARWSFNATTEAYALPASAIMIPLAVARTARLLQIAYNATAISSTTSTIDTCIYQQNFNNGGQNYFGAISNIQTQSVTTTTGIRYSVHDVTLQAGVSYLLGMGGSGYTVTAIRSIGAPSARPLAGTYGPGGNATNTVAWQNATQSIAYLSGTRPSSLGSFYWGDLNFSNSIPQPAVSLQLRTV